MGTTHGQHEARPPGTNDRPSPGESLDNLAARAAAGDPSAEKLLFSTLRERFLPLAKQRVQEEDHEDIVQDALRVVVARYRERPSAEGILPWSLVVLRNVIGNYYQRRSRNIRHESLDDRDDIEAEFATRHALSPDVFDDSREVIERVTGAIARLSSERPTCGTIFRRILESLELGGGPRKISGRAMAGVREDHPDMSSGSFYVTLHRCRLRLREILRELEEEVAP